MPISLCKFVKSTARKFIQRISRMMIIYINEIYVYAYQYDDDDDHDDQQR